MMPPNLSRRRLFAVAPGAALVLAGCEATPTPATQPTPPEADALSSAVANRAVGQVTLRRNQVAFIGNVAWGSGTLTFDGNTHPVLIRGLGAGGFGVSRMDATGDVFNLRRLSDFEGVYGQARAGVVAGPIQARGFVWLQNPAGVRIRLRPVRQGVALQVGADGILIQFRQT